MSDETTRTLVIEKDFPYAPEKLWRALTESPLLAQWMLSNDFKAEVGHRFDFRNEPQPAWDGVIACEVLVVEPGKRLAYSWNALGLESVVRWTLTPTAHGTHLRMEQSGFRADQRAAYGGAQHGWQYFLRNLEDVMEALG